MLFAACWSLLSDQSIRPPSLPSSESEQLEAVAQFDFTARSPRELSFHCGAVLTLYRQVSADWWRGHFRGRDGLVPDKYIMLKIRCVTACPQESVVRVWTVEAVGRRGIINGRVFCIVSLPLMWSYLFIDTRSYLFAISVKSEPQSLYDQWGVSPLDSPLDGGV